MNQINWDNMILSMFEIELVLGKELFRETVKGIKEGKRTSIGKDWEHDQGVFDDLCRNLGYVPYFESIG